MWANIYLPTRVNYSFLGTSFDEHYMSTRPLYGEITHRVTAIRHETKKIQANIYIHI